MKNYMINEISDTYLAYQMYKLCKIIDMINKNKNNYSDIYIQKVFIQRKNLLNYYCKKKFGDNVISFTN